MKLESVIKTFNSMILDLVAKEVETSLKRCRGELNEFKDKLMSSFKKTANRVTNQNLNLFTQYVPPIKVGMSLLNSSKEYLERMSERDISEQEILRLLETGITTSPLQLLQQRKKEVIIKAQVNLMRELKVYTMTLQELNRKALLPDGPDESELFQEQYKFLPSYSRRKVLFGYPLIAGNKQ
jgi:hypothetical protein